MAIWWKLPRKARLRKVLIERVPWKQLYADEFGWDGQSNVVCFVHEDKDPSMSFYDDGAAFCHGCGWKASSFIGVLEEKWEATYKETCRTLYASYVESLVDEREIQRMHKALTKDDELLRRIKSAMGVTALQVERFELGWHNRRKRLAIPVRNEFGMCVDVRLYDVFKEKPPGQKVVSWTKGYGTARLWPPRDSERVVLCEGEKDALAAMSIGLPGQTLTSAATAELGAYELKQLRAKHVWVAYDNDAAGRRGATKRAAELTGVAKSVTVVTLPVKDAKEDMWDWVHKYGGTKDAFWKLADAVEPEAGGERQRATGETLDDVFGPEGPESGVAKAQMIAEHMLRTGWFYRMPSGGVSYATAGSCVTVDRRDKAFRSMMMGMDPRINREIPMGRVIIEHVENVALQVAKGVSASTQFLFDARRSELYWRPRKSSQMVLMADAAGIREVRNGDNPGGALLLLEDYALADWEWEGEGLAPNKALDWMWRELFSWIPAPDYQRVMVMAWLLAGMFKQLTSDRPVLRVMAPSASGKSHVLRMLASLMYADHNMYDEPSTTVASLYSNAARRPLLMLDNIELQHLREKEGLADLFISLATSAVKEKRKGGTDVETVREGVDCIAATTGIEPFNKTELINRFLYVQVDRDRYGSADYFDHERFEAIKLGRGPAMRGVFAAAAGMLKDLPTRLRERSAGLARTNRGLRFPGYAAIMSLWIDRILQVVKPKCETTGEVLLPSQVMERMLSHQIEQTREQDEGTNPVLAWLDSLWVRTCGSPPTFVEGAYRPIREGDTATWYMTSTELLNELSLLARMLGRRLPFDNAHQLAVRIVDSKALLGEAGWTVERYRTAGRNFVKLTKVGRIADGTEAKAVHDLARDMAKVKRKG